MRKNLMRMSAHGFKSRTTMSGTGAKGKSALGQGGRWNNDQSCGDIWSRQHQGPSNRTEEIFSCRIISEPMGLRLGGNSV